MHEDDQDYFKNELCSVIVAMYNRHEYVSDALESVWHQTYRPLELIIIDDGSSDSSPHVVSEWISNHQNDPTFQIIFHRQTNQGLCAVRNYGLMISKGEFIQCLDDDDIMYPEKIAKKVKYLLEHPEIEIVACNLDYLDANLKYITKTNLREPFVNEPMHHFIMRQDLMSYAPVYHKQTLLRVGGWSAGLPCGVDNDLHARLSIEGAKFAIINDVLGGIRCHSNGRMTGTARFSGNKNASYYEVDAYTRIINFAKLSDKLDPIFLNLIASRLRESSRMYLIKCMPDRASIGLAFARRLCPESVTWLDRLYESFVGRYIAILFEYLRFHVLRLVRFVRRLAIM